MLAFLTLKTQSVICWFFVELLLEDQEDDQEHDGESEGPNKKKVKFNKTSSCPSSSEKKKKTSMAPRKVVPRKKLMP